MEKNLKKDKPLFTKKYSLLHYMVVNFSVLYSDIFMYNLNIKIFRKAKVIKQENITKSSVTLI